MRPCLDEIGIQLAWVWSQRSTCRRRRVGAVLTDWRGHVLATGFNGTPRAMPHCIEKPCPGAGLPSGQGLDLCEAVHAEANALLRCPDVDQIQTCYSTTAPCVGCIKLLMNTNCSRIIFAVPYAEEHMALARKRWLSRGHNYVWKQHLPAGGLLDAQGLEVPMASAR